MKQDSFFKRHSLSISATAVLLLWFGLYLRSDYQSHPGSLFGNAVADWIGVVMTVLITKWLFERGSSESRQPRKEYRNRFLEFMHEHSLSIFLSVTGAGWILLFLEIDPLSRWGTVTGSITSEWTQQLGMVVMTKKLIESGSKESSGR